MSFYTEVIQKSKYYKSIGRVASMDLLEPGTRKAVEEILAMAKKAGWDLRVLETYRSPARQAYLFSRGATKLRKVGCHGYGLAADFGLYHQEKYIEDGSKYKFLLGLCKEVGMISGIDWGHTGKPNKFVDAGHVQRIPVARQNELFAGTWYPAADYNPWKGA